MDNQQELTIKEKQAIILEIMKDIDRFCRANGIRYSLSSGTLLGAVRHGGFIPWDDDADMFMLREDFERFVKTYKSDRYDLLYDIDPLKRYQVKGYAKVGDPATGTKSSGSISSYGMFVDVFPLDYVPEDPKECHKWMHKLMRIHNRIYHRQKRDFNSIRKSYFHSLDWWWRKLGETVRNSPYTGSPLVAHAVGTTNYRTVIRKDRFDSLIDTPFESYNFLGFSDPGSYLEIVYGPDYMTPKQWNHNLKIYRKDE